MKTLFLALSFAFVFTLPVYALDVTTLVFTQTSSAVSSTANLKIAVADNLGQNKGVWVQGMPFPATQSSYYVTKRTSVSIPNGNAGKIYIIQTPLTDMLMCTNSDETNCMTLFGGTEKVFIAR